MCTVCAVWSILPSESLVSGLTPAGKRKVFNSVCEGSAYTNRIFTVYLRVYCPSREVHRYVNVFLKSCALLPDVCAAPFTVTVPGVIKVGIRLSGFALPVYSTVAVIVPSCPSFAMAAIESVFSSLFLSLVKRKSVMLRTVSGSSLNKINRRYSVRSVPKVMIIFASAVPRWYCAPDGFSGVKGMVSAALYRVPLYSIRAASPAYATSQYSEKAPEPVYSTGYNSSAVTVFAAWSIRTVPSFTNAEFFTFEKPKFFSAAPVTVCLHLAVYSFTSLSLPSTANCTGLVKSIGLLSGTVTLERLTGAKRARKYASLFGAVM